MPQGRIDKESVEYVRISVLLISKKNSNNFLKRVFQRKNNNSLKFEVSENQKFITLKHKGPWSQTAHKTFHKHM